MPSAHPRWRRNSKPKPEPSLGINYALAVSSGTAALEISLAAAGVGPGDEVIVPAWSWISCYTAIVRVGARPVLAEIDASLCLDPARDCTTPHVAHPGRARSAFSGSGGRNGAYPA
jgi:hypothetical protein